MSGRRQSTRSRLRTNSSSTAQRRQSGNNSNSNRNVNNSEARPGFMSAWDEVWNDLRTVLRAAPELANNDKDDDELMTCTDESVDVLAQSVVQDVYLSVSKCETDLEVIEDHQNRLITSMIAMIDAQPTTVRTDSNHNDNNDN